jgi:hypothetical protein
MVVPVVPELCGCHNLSSRGYFSDVTMEGSPS